MNASISTSELKSALVGPHPPVVIDVRRSPAFHAAADMIAGALRRDPNGISSWAKALPRVGSVVTYCIHGHEVSQGAAAALRKFGIDACYLQDGLEEGWKLRAAHSIRSPPEPARAAGPHGLDLDPVTGLLLCACDAGVLLSIEPGSGLVTGQVFLSGAPDVIFLHAQSRRLYVAIGDPGVIDVIDVARMGRVEVVTTEAGAHTLALDRKRNKTYAFLPRSHRAAVFVDEA